MMTSYYGVLEHPLLYEYNIAFESMRKWQMHFGKEKLPLVVMEKSEKN